MISVNVDIDDLNHVGINTCLSAHRRLDVIMDFSNSWDLIGELIEELKVDLNFHDDREVNPWMASFHDDEGNSFFADSDTPCSAVAKVVLSSYIEDDEVILPLKNICNHLKSTKDVIDMIVEGNDYHDCDINLSSDNEYVVTFKSDNNSYNEKLTQCLLDLNKVGDIEIKEK
ncbi:MAG: hypothetical protein RSC68_24875 [Acinetobacter sp.]